MNILFICSRNKWRSRTAETIFRDMPDWNVRSAGTASSAVVKVNAKHIGWADIILVMEKRHKSILQQAFPEVNEKELHILDIPDDYEYMDPELIEDLKTKVAACLK